jgi:cytochrome c
MEKRNRAASDDAVAPPGLALMRRTTCFACHSATEKSAGPPYAAVAARYAEVGGARDGLTAKIIAGGTGVWGEIPMPPHPQHSPAEVSQMVDWILSLSQRQITALAPGTSGTLEFKEPGRDWGRAENGVIALAASATDKGAGKLPPQRGETEIVLRSRRQRAAFFDRGHLATTQDNLDQGGIVARIPAGGWIAFDRIRLSETGGLRLQAWPQGSGRLTTIVRAGSDTGPVLSKIELTPGEGGGRPGEIQLPFNDTPRDAAPQPVIIAVEGPPGSLLDVIWAEFKKP